jgi:CheY-like chemotaxis protein
MNETNGGYALIVDDDQSTRETLSRALDTLGMHTEVARDGLEALDMIGQAPPDLILLDVMMPRLDGLSMLVRLRKDPRTCRIPVIVVSACPVEESKLSNLPGVNRVMQKSEFSMIAIRNMLADVMGSERSVA